MERLDVLDLLENPPPLLKELFAARVADSDRRAPEPRGLPTPSPRNLEIYRDVRLLGRTQAEAAAGRNISRRRVAQIVRQVDEWRSATGGLAHKHIERRLARERLEEVYAASMRLTHQSTAMLEAEPNEAHRRAGLQSLRVALRAARMLSSLSRRAAPTEGSEPAAEQADPLLVVPGEER